MHTLTMLCAFVVLASLGTYLIRNKVRLPGWVLVALAILVIVKF